MGIIYHIKNAKEVLVHCNIVNNHYQHDSRVFGKSLYILTNNFVFLKAF